MQFQLLRIRRQGNRVLGDFLPSRQSAQEGILIGIFKITPYRQTAGQPGDMHI
jgi:hypothetical protein